MWLGGGSWGRASAKRQKAYSVPRALNTPRGAHGSTKTSKTPPGEQTLKVGQNGRLGGQGTSLVNEQRGSMGERETDTGSCWASSAPVCPTSMGQTPSLGSCTRSRRSCTPQPCPLSAPLPLPGVPKPTPSPPAMVPPRDNKWLVLTCLVEEEEEQAPKHVHRPVARGEKLCKKQMVRRGTLLPLDGWR